MTQLRDVIAVHASPNHAMHRPDGPGACTPDQPAPSPHRPPLTHSLPAILAAVFVSAAAVSPERAAELERLVLQDCGSCHGLTLRGGLGPDIRAETLAGTLPETLMSIILDGVPGRAMPPWRPLLSEVEARWIADYLLSGGRP